MRIGVPAEVKPQEGRVALTPAGVSELVRDGNEVFVQRGAGVASGYADADYQAQGAVVRSDAASVWGDAELVVKVKEPTPQEYAYFREDLTLFTYLHLAADAPLTTALVASGARAVAYETVRGVDGRLPLLAPMSEVAGRMATMAGLHHSLRPHGGSGLLLGGVPGTDRGRVLIIGGGVAGENAATVAVGIGTEVTIIDRDISRLRALDSRFGGKVTMRGADPLTIADLVSQADLVIGSVLVPGASAPKLVSEQMVRGARPGTVFVDIAIDQGGCFEGSHPTTHADPVFVQHDTLFYCVANMPGAAPRTSTVALTNVTTPYVRQIAGLGWRNAAETDPGLAAGLSVEAGRVTDDAVASSLAGVR